LACAAFSAVSNRTMVMADDHLYLWLNALHELTLA
jgi:hypothetical protein